MPSTKRHCRQEESYESDDSLCIFSGSRQSTTATERAKKKKRRSSGSLVMLDKDSPVVRITTTSADVKELPRWTTIQERDEILDPNIQIVLWEIDCNDTVSSYQFQGVRELAGVAPDFPAPLNIAKRNGQTEDGFNTLVSDWVVDDVLRIVPPVTEYDRGLILADVRTSQRQHVVENSSSSSRRRRRRRSTSNHHHRAKAKISWSLLINIIAIIFGCLSFVPVKALSITTFNILAAVHRSMPTTIESLEESTNRRESEQREWWLPRAEGLARFVAEELASSDVVLLQEWWFGPEFQDIFDQHTSAIFDRVSEQRPGPVAGTLREDGMAVLVKKKSKGGKLELLGSTKIQTGPQRIAQVVTCQERSHGKRFVVLGNAHLSFPGGPDPVANERRQAFEAHLLARALSNTGRQLSSSTTTTEGGHLQILAGDFNSNSQAQASAVLESTRHYNFINCMSAHAEQNLNSIGGSVNIGVTHRTHRGEDVSVDQIFARLMKDDGSVSKTALRRLGGPAGTHVVDCRKRLLNLVGEGILSDHMPVTATLYWPTTTTTIPIGKDADHPLRSPWDS